MANLVGKNFGFLKAARIFGGAVGAGVLAFVFAQCGGGGGKTLTADEFCEQYAQNECAKTATLCAVPATTCEAEREARCQTMIASWQTGPRTFHPSKANNCLNQVKNIYGKDFITPGDFAGVSETCNRVFSGDVAKDKTCTVDYDCADGLICDKSICEPRVEKKRDELCNDPGSVCEKGYDCLVRSDTVKACVSKKMLGEPCAVTRDCKEELQCDGSKCIQRVPLNSACKVNDDCQASAPYCNTNLSAPLCSAGLRFAAEAATCIEYGYKPAGGTGGAGATGGAGGSGAGATGGAAGGSEG